MAGCFAIGQPSFLSPLGQVYLLLFGFYGPVGVSQLCFLRAENGTCLVRIPTRCSPCAGLPPWYLLTPSSWPLGGSSPTPSLVTDEETKAAG